MPLLQALIVSVIYVLSAVFPISVTAHHWAISYFLGWEAPPAEFLGMLAASGFLAVFIYFIHDWASLISSFLRVILLWKSPKTLDERLLFFIMVSAIPIAVAWFYGRTIFENLEVTPIWIAACLVFFCIPAWLGDRLNRQQKNMLNWTALDAFWVGLMQVQALLPGAGRQIGTLAAAYLRNYNRESGAKFSFLSFAPVLLLFAISNLREFSFSNVEPAYGVSWLTFSVCFVASFLCGLLAIGGFMKNIERKTFGSSYAYRIALAATILVTYWIRLRSES